MPHALARAATMNSPRPVIESASISGASRFSESGPTPARAAIDAAGVPPGSMTLTRTSRGSAVISTSNHSMRVCSVVLVASSVAVSPTS
jgi:hypothetical protein